MGSFNFHIIAHTVEDKVESIANDLIKVLTDAGHVVDKVTLTTDAGAKVLAQNVTADAPAIESAVSTTGTDVSNILLDVEGEVKDLEAKLESANPTPPSPTDTTDTSTSGESSGATS